MENEIILQECYWHGKHIGKIVISKSELANSKKAIEADTWDKMGYGRYADILQKHGIKVPKKQKC